jgi:hypothetical protein
MSITACERILRKSKKIKLCKFSECLVETDRELACQDFSLKIEEKNVGKGELMYRSTSR